MDKSVDDLTKNTLLKKIAPGQRQSQSAPRGWSAKKPQQQNLGSAGAARMPASERFKIPANYDISKQFAGTNGRHFTTLDKIPAMPKSGWLTTPEPEHHVAHIETIESAADLPSVKENLRASRTRIPVISRFDSLAPDAESMSFMELNSGSDHFPASAVVQKIAYQMKNAPDIAKSDSNGSKVQGVPVAYVEAKAFYANRPGLYSLRHLVRLLQYEIDRAIVFSRSVLVIIAAIENFPMLSLKGSQALEMTERMAFELLKPAFRKIDLIGVFSEGRFIVVCPEMSVEEAQQRAAILCKGAVSSNLVCDGETFNFSFSVGIAQSSAEISDIESLLAMADLSADDASAAGGNAVCF